MPTVRTHIVRNLLVPIAAVIFAWGAAAVILVNRAQGEAVQPDEGAIHIDVQGRAWQGERWVGSFLPGDDGQKLTLRLKPATAFGSYFLPILLPKPLNPDDVRLGVTSIQGTAAVSFTMSSSDEAFLFFPGALADAQSAAMVLVPDGTFSVPFPVLAYASIVQADLKSWLVASAALLALTLATIRWLTRRPRSRKPGSQESPPDGLTAVELGLLADGFLGPKELSALLFDLADRGLMEVIERDGEVYFLRRQRHDIAVQPYEERLLALVAPPNQEPRRLGDIAEEFSRSLFSEAVSQVYVATYAALAERGYFREDIRFTHLRYKTIGIAIQFFSLAACLACYVGLSAKAPGGVLFTLSGYIAGVLVYRSAYRIRPFTEKGRDCLAAVEDFHTYLSSPAPLRAAGLQGLLFYEYLPHALVLKCLNPWYQRFAQSVSFYVPDWYASATEEAAEPVRFIMQVEAITSNLAVLFDAVKDPNAD